MEKIKPMPYVRDEDGVEVQNRHAIARFPAKVTSAISPGTVFVPLYWGAPLGRLRRSQCRDHPEACPYSLQPDLKACAGQLLPISLKTVAADYVTTVR